MSKSTIQIANEILRQLGGNKFIVMTGSSHFVGCDEKRQLTMKLKRNQGKATNLRITLAADDTYTMEWLKIVNATKSNNWIPRLDTLETVEGVYNDQLQKQFTAFTGMDTHL